MICSFDPAISVRLAVAHHLELLAAKKKKKRTDSLTLGGC